MSIFEGYLDKSFDLDGTFKEYQTYLNGGDNIEKLLVGFYPPIAHLCHNYMTTFQGDFDFFCNNALVKIYEIMKYNRDQKILGFLPTAKEFRNFFYKVIRNSFLDTVGELDYQKYVEIPSGTPPCARQISPRFLVDYEMFTKSLQKNLVAFVLEQDRYGLDKFTIEYVVERFLAQEDSSLEVLTRIFGVKNPHFIKSYLLVLVKAYLFIAKKEYEVEEIEIFVERRMESFDEQ